MSGIKWNKGLKVAVNLLSGKANHSTHIPPVLSRPRHCFEALWSGMGVK